MFLVLISVLFASVSGCIKDAEDEEESDYFSETYTKIPMSFRFDSKQSGNDSYVIIPAALQHGRILNLSEFQNMSEHSNFSYDIVDTEYGNGLRISPIPQGDFFIWFETDPYTAKGPFNIRQDAQFYQTDWPGLSTWETDGDHGYYWFFCSENITGLWFRFEYSDCYFFTDSAMIMDLETNGWIKVQFQRTQMDMEM